MHKVYIYIYIHMFAIRFYLMYRCLSLFVSEIYFTIVYPHFFDKPISFGQTVWIPWVGAGVLEDRASAAAIFFGTGHEPSLLFLGWTLATFGDPYFRPIFSTHFPSSEKQVAKWWDVKPHSELGLFNARTSITFHDVFVAAVNRYKSSIRVLSHPRHTIWTVSLVRRKWHFVWLVRCAYFESISYVGLVSHTASDTQVFVVCLRG